MGTISIKEQWAVQNFHEADVTSLRGHSQGLGGPAVRCMTGFIALVVESGQIHGYMAVSHLFQQMQMHKDVPTCPS